MPKVIIDPKQGLIQKAGSGLVVKEGTPVTLAGTLHGQRHGVNSAISSDTTLSLSDSGKVFVLGDSGDQPQSAYTVQFPVNKAGWNARFYLTGAIGVPIHISASAATTTGTPVRIFDTIVTSSIASSAGGGNGITAETSQTGTGSVQLQFVHTGAFTFGQNEHFGDHIDIVVGVANSIVFATGLVGSGTLGRQVLHL